MRLSPVYKMRPFVPADFKLVMDSWSKSWRESPWAGAIPNNRFHAVFTDAVAQLVERGAQFVVLCAAANEDQIIGWACYELVRDGTALHYLYVKDPFRRRGLGAELVQAVKEAHGTSDRTFYTHRTRFADSSIFRGFRHAPEIARRK